VTFLEVRERTCAAICEHHVRAGIEAVWHVPCGGVPFGDESLLYVANDWHTALLPVYLRAFYQARPRTYTLPYPDQPSRLCEC
jgi:hypothetical protein